MEASAAIVYGYTDPSTRALRYVGKSSVGLARAERFDAHSGHCLNWVRSLAAAGLVPGVVVLEDLGPRATAEELNEAERHNIAYYRFLGCELTNLTVGGDGVMAGRKHTIDAKAKISASHKGLPGVKSFLGRRHSPETIEKMRAAKLGKPRSPEARAAIAAGKTGKAQSPEHVEKRAAACRGRRQSPEHVAKRTTSRLATLALKAAK